MLTTLRIKNLALVVDLTLELQPGYNAITGETGAGKSIIMGALNLVLGERADRTLIRAGSDACSVEAVFDVAKLRSPLKSFLDENGLEPCDENQLVLKRSLTSAGVNRQFINGSPTTLGILATLGESLVDMHGPHDHQSLLHPAKQLAILDAFGNLSARRESFATLVHRRVALDAEKAALIVDEKTYALQLDLLRFQVHEITTARLEADEELRLLPEHQRASNAVRLLELSQTALGCLSENDQSVLGAIGMLGRTLQELRRIDPATEALITAHEQGASVFRDLQNDLSHYADKVDIDPARMKELEERVSLLQSLKRKYGGSVEQVITFGDEARQKLDQLEQRDAELMRLNAECERLDAELWRAGAELSAERRRLIPKLARAATSQLKDLGFAQSHFDIAVSTLDRKSGLTPTASGLDTIEFQFAPNPGEPPRPLRAIASSGELARVMLALKTVLAGVDEIPVLIFDEVDANVGGETANAVGVKMREIARQRQVLCITHLAPVAAHANTHYLVAKQVKDGRTISEITALNRADRTTELARMLGGQSDAIRKHAEELLKLQVF